MIKDKRTIYINVDTPILGFTYFNFFVLCTFKGGELKKPPCITYVGSMGAKASLQDGSLKVFPKCIRLGLSSGQLKAAFDKPRS